MSHEVENMFYVGETPWHGLGIPLNNPPTIEDAIVLAGLDWTVSKHQLYYDARDDGATSLTKVPRHAVLRDTDNAYLGTVGKNWTPLQNVDAFKFFQPFLDSGDASLETAGSLRKGKHVWVLAKINSDPVSIVGDDVIYKYLLLANGHDGSMAVTPGLTPIRAVCANTLAAALEGDELKAIRIVHGVNVKANTMMVRETIDLIDRQFTATAEIYQELAKRQINKSDLELFVKKTFFSKRKLRAMEKKYKEVGEYPSDGKRLLDNIIPLFEKGRGNDMAGVRGTWWAAYNSVTEYLAHERGRNQDIRLDSLWFGQNASTNKRALDIAQTMALA